MIVKSNITFISLFVGAAVTFMGCSSVQAHRAQSAFEYNEIYMPQTLGSNAKNYGLNTVDQDWGIWGHNLAKALPEKPSMAIFAKRNGKDTDDSQFCFSSNHLYSYLEEYISDKYGETDTVRFAIMPNDNEIVCMCAKCVEKGNTKNDASPAVFALMRRLCERFPNHIFFTSDYMTTKSLPDKPLPANAGVLVSAIDYPRLPESTPEEEAFFNRIAQWKQFVDRVYVWEYINNYDDYFTPIPLLSVMQHRLQKYRDAGVQGVFMNGSGRDYMSLGDVNAPILAALLLDPDYEWKEGLKEVVTERYPVSGQTIYNFMIEQENYLAQQHTPLPMYGGVPDALKSYLPAERFLVFYDELSDQFPKTHGAEHEALDRLIDAISLPRLGIARLSGNLEGTQEPLEHLYELVDMGTDAYNESYWAVSDYVKDFSFIAGHARAMEGRNLLKGIKLKNLTPLDPDYSDISIITDGVLGLPSNYHCGNLISSATPSLDIEIPYIEGMEHLRVALVANSSYRIGLPERVTLSYGGANIAEVEPKRLKEHTGHSFVEFDIPSSVKGPMVVRLFRNPEIRTMAIDEIEAY